MRPIIDLSATGANIRHLRFERGITVAEIQSFLELESCRIVFKWQQGKCLPGIENLLGLSILFAIPINDILRIAE